MGTKSVKVTNGISMGLQYAITAQDIIDESILIDFNTPYDLAGVIDIYDSAGIHKDLLGVEITYPANGQVQIDFSVGTGGDAEETDIEVVADVAGSLGGKYFTLNSPTVDYYVWYDVTARAEVSTVQTVADVAGSLGGKYFTLNDTATDYYVWLNVGTDVAEVSTVQTVADVAGSLGGKYFTLNSPTTAYYVWLSVYALDVAEETDIETVADVAGSLNGKYFTLDSPSTAYYVWLNVTARAEVTTIQTVADVTGSLDGKYFTISSPTNDYYVWINVNGGGTDPEPGGGLLEIEVAVATDATADTVATAIKNAIDLYGDFTVIVLTDTVTVTNASIGSVVDSADVDTGFTIIVTQQGIDAGVDPTPALKTGIEVEIAGDSTDETIATAIQVVLDAMTTVFDATVSTNTVTVTNVDTGVTTDSADVDSGFSITVTTQGVTASVDPAVVDKTGIKVAITEGDTADTIATAINAILDAMTTVFSTSVLTDTVTITNEVIGSTTNLTAGDSGFTVGVTTPGDEVSTDPAVASMTGIQVDITRDDTADTIATAINAILDAMTGSFSTSVLTDTVTITNDISLDATDLTAGDSGFTVAVTTQGIDTSVDPAIAGKTGISVTISGDDNATAVALATQLILDAMTTIFDATVLTDTISLTNKVDGSAVDGTAGDSGFTLTVTQQGASDFVTGDLVEVIAQLNSNI